MRFGGDCQVSLGLLRVEDADNEILIGLSLPALLYVI